MKALGHRARRHHCNRHSHRHDALFPPFQGLWSRQRNTTRSLLRGKCPVATRFFRKRNTIRAEAQQSHPRQRLVRQGGSHSGRTPGARGPKIGSCGSDPPENGPGLYKRSFRRGRSRDFSLQEGGAAPKGRGGVRRGHSDCHAALSTYAVRVKVQCLVVSGFDCGDSLGLHLPSTNWDQPRRSHVLSGPTLLDGRRKASESCPLHVR